MDDEQRPLGSIDHVVSFARDEAELMADRLDDATRNIRLRGSCTAWEFDEGVETRRPAA